MRKISMCVVVFKHIVELAHTAKLPAPCSDNGRSSHADVLFSYAEVGVQCMAKRSKRGLAALCGNRAGGIWASGQLGSHVVMGHGHGRWVGVRRSQPQVDIFADACRCWELIGEYAPHRAAQARSFAVNHTVDGDAVRCMHMARHGTLLSSLALILTMALGVCQMQTRCTRCWSTFESVSKAGVCLWARGQLRRLMMDRTTVR